MCFHDFYVFLLYLNVETHNTINWGEAFCLCSWICVQVCKYFLDAVEKKQYGWFWVCPNGGKDCHYRHALPPGYVLKSQMKALLEEESEKITIEEEIENQVIHLSLDHLLHNALFWPVPFQNHFS